MQLHQLDPQVPEAHQTWTDEDYAGRIVVALGRAGNRFLQLNGEAAQDEVSLQPDLVEALVAAMEWARLRGWPVEQAAARIIAGSQTN